VPDMRFAPPNPLRIADRAGGLNALSVRSYNERLVLSLLLQSDTITRLEIGEKTGLSAQTVSVIIRSLEQEGLVKRGEQQRGRVGPPTTPLLLNPEGAYSIGVSVGYWNTQVVVVDFVGNLRHRRILHHNAPAQIEPVSLLIDTIREASRTLGGGKEGRIAGIGLALPIDEKSTESGTEPLHRELEREFGLPVFIQNDVTAAASGESLFGAAKTLTDFLFFHLGARLHSRLILNHQIYNGNSPLSFNVGVLDLESSLTSHPDIQRQLWELDGEWPDLGDILPPWKDRCTATLVSSVESLTQFVDIKTVVLSSFVPTAISQDMCAAFEKRLPHIRALVGKTSPASKAVGAAGLSFSSRFMVE
jgi:DNA-binding transcriptional ArsR family regulator